MADTKRTTRAALAGATIAGVGLAFVAGVAVGGDKDPLRRVAIGDRPLDQDRIVLSNADVTITESCDDLLAHYVERGLERVTAWGWDGGGPIAFAEGAEAAREFDSADQSGASAPTVPQTTRSGSSETGTNVQEEGVDEPDVVKTLDGLLVRVQDDDLLTTYSLDGDEPQLLDSLDLEDVEGAEILLVGDDIVVVGRDTEIPVGGEDVVFSGASRTRMLVVDAADPAALEVVSTSVYDAGLVTARLHGSAVRVALSAGLPALDFVQPSTWRGEQTALARNQRIVADSTIEDWLPTVSTDGREPEPLLECGDVAMPEDDTGLGTMAVVGFDPAFPDTWEAAAVTTDSQIVYVSADRLVLATSPWWGWGGPVIDCFDRCVAPEPSFAGDGNTHLYSFALTGLDATFVAGGEVEGSVADRWSIDEADGVLRIAVGPTSETGNFNSVVTLREEGDDLVEAGRVDELGPNEEIKSVRWFDDLAIVVTFRQVDPLYAVDLTDPDAPVLLGELKIPGFSEYLHPLGSWRMIGMGQAATTDGMLQGAQAALFDVHNVTNPQQLDVVEYAGGTQAMAGLDPRQFTWLPDRRTALTVVSDGGTGMVSVLTVDDSGLAKRDVPVEYGTDIGQVRLVPVADGRVVLVTGDQVSFFDV